MTNLLKFYADTPRGDRNRIFKRRCFGPNGVRNCIINHTEKHGFYIRAAYIQEGNSSRKIELSNYHQNNINREKFHPTTNDFKGTLIKKIYHKLKKEINEHDNGHN